MQITKTAPIVTAATLIAAAALAPAASASANEGFNPRGVEWPAAHGALPAQPPYATFANQQDTVRCGVYTIDGQDFIHCLSLVDTMPGHMCAGQGKANAMNLGKWDAWDCADTNAFAGAPTMGNLQLRRYGTTFVASDTKGNFFIGDRELSRVIRVGEINDIYADHSRIIAFNSKLRGSSIPAMSSI